MLAASATLRAGVPAALSRRAARAPAQCHARACAAPSTRLAQASSGAGAVGRQRRRLTAHVSACGLSVQQQLWPRCRGAESCFDLPTCRGVISCLFERQGKTVGLHHSCRCWVHRCTQQVWRSFVHTGIASFSQQTISCAHCENSRTETASIFQPLCSPWCGAWIRPASVRSWTKSGMCCSSCPRPSGRLHCMENPL